MPLSPNAEVKRTIEVIYLAGSSIRIGELLVAEVKTGEEAPNFATTATRRQLLEYHVAFAADGILLVCPERGTIHRIVFPIRAVSRNASAAGRR